CVVGTIEAMMKTKKSLDKMTTIPFEELPTVKKVLGRIKEEDGNVTYHDSTAESLYNHIAELFEADDIPMSNICGFAADTTNIMFGLNVCVD
uniref:Uncharacterized protein n=1 Tax=Amphimedon queenslandica TaxID=400682 RepID=A0A1X7V9Z0_AMPQE